MSYILQNCLLESCAVSIFVEGRDRICAQSGTRLVRSRNRSTCSHRSIYTLVINITRKSMVTMAQYIWNVMAHGDTREEKWRGNWRMEWVASTLHTTITTADANSSAASSRLNWRHRRFKWTCPFRRKTKSGFCACAIIFQTQSIKTTVARSQILMAVAAKITVFWDVTLYICRPVEIFRRFGGAYCLPLLPRKKSSLAEVVSPRNQALQAALQLHHTAAVT